MEQQNRSYSPIASGLLISLLLIVVSMVVAYTTGLRGQQWTQWIGYLIIVIGLIWVILKLSKETNHSTGFGDLFAYGFKVTTVMICIMIIFTILFSYLNPEMKEEVIQAAREQALNRPGVSESEIDKGMELFEKNYTLFLLISIIFAYLILGVVGSLLGAAIAKKNPRSPFDTTDNQS
jgi:amino acid transporter